MGAWVILVFLMGGVVVLREERRGADALVMVLIIAVYYLYLLLCIRYIRGKRMASRKPPYHETEIGTWGYLWRGWVAMLVTAFLLAFFSSFAMGPISGLAVFLIATPLVIWLLFCPDRIAFVKRILAHVRGMPA